MKNSTTRKKIKRDNVVTIESNSRFTATKQRKRIIRPASKSLEADDHIVYSVSGQDLSKFGLIEGDHIICKRNCEWSDVKTGRICIVFYPASNSSFAKYCYFDSENSTVYVFGINETKACSPQELLLKAIVVSFQRDWEVENE